MLGFHALYQLGFGTLTLINPQSLEVPYAFPSQVVPALFLIVLMLSFGQFFLAATAFFSIIMTIKSHFSGPVLGIFLGSYFLLLGITGLLTADQRATLFIDVVRGLLTLLAGVGVLRKTTVALP